MSSPLFHRPARISGRNLVFRPAQPDDAAFILTLRTDAVKGQHLSATANDLERQRQWLRDSAKDPEQLYFMIEDRQGDRCGTVRLYNRQDESFCWGSWILKDGCPSSHSIESALMVYRYALFLGFRAAHFEVRKGNESVWRFHERFGATRVGADADSYHYRLAPEALQTALARYSRFLSEGIRID